MQLLRLETHAILCPALSRAFGFDSFSSICAAHSSSVYSYPHRIPPSVLTLVSISLLPHFKAMERDIQPAIDHQTAERRSVRANRACAACRVRKQRCILSSTTRQAACERCASHAMPCSFETDPTVAHQDQPGPTKLAQMVVQLQQRYSSCACTAGHVAS